jgi:hypothetical protein
MNESSVKPACVLRTIQLVFPLRMESNGHFVAIVDGEEREAEVNAVHVDAAGAPGGYASVHFPHSAVTYEGFLDEGSFEGPLLVALNDGRYQVARVRSNVLHGLSVILGLDHLYSPAESLKRIQGHGLPGLGMLVNYRQVAGICGKNIVLFERLTFIW